LIRIYIFLLFIFIWVAVVIADGSPEALPSFLDGGKNGAWISSRGAVLRAGVSSRSKITRKTVLGDPVEVLDAKGGRSKVKHISGKTGWVSSDDLSTVWILVLKKARVLKFMNGRQEKGKWKIDLGPDPVGDKEMEGSRAPGHYRTPEGEFYVARHVPRSSFHRAFLLSYPSIHHAEKGLKNGLINKNEYNKIVSAIESRRVPPQNTKLGSYIEIHGSGTGGKLDWTLGCVALENKVMDFLWGKVPVGAPVVILP